MGCRVNEPEDLRRCAISEVTTPRWTFGHDVAAYKEAGWGAIGVWLQKFEHHPFDYRRLPREAISKQTLAAAADTIGAAGIEVSSVICAGNLTHPRPDARRAQEATSRLAIEAAQRLRAPCVLILPGGLCGTSRESAMRRSARALRHLAGYAEDHGVRLAIEPLHRTQTDFVTSLAETLELVERVDHPSCGVYLDTVQLAQSDDPLAEIARCTGRIFGLHVADAKNRDSSPDDRLVPGEGALPLVELLQAAVTAGFDGYFEVEVISTSLWRLDEHELLSRCAAGMLRIISQVA